MLAYREGIFPWFAEDSPIIWWSPDPRMVLFPNRLKVSKSLKLTLKRDDFRVTFDQAFDEVITQCASTPRFKEEGTWITSEMVIAYQRLHRSGFARSVEVWKGDSLVGGLYGVDIGHIFCGESMFHTVSDASKVAFVKLVEKLQKENYALIDCQVYTEHLESLGAEEIPREQFIDILKQG